MLCVPFSLFLASLIRKIGLSIFIYVEKIRVQNSKSCVTRVEFPSNVEFQKLHVSFMSSVWIFKVEGSCFEIFAWELSLYMLLSHGSIMKLSL